MGDAQRTRRRDLNAAAWHDGLSRDIPPSLDTRQARHDRPDQSSGGRIELGLGAGWNEHEHAAYGFPFSDTRTRMDMLEEQLQVILGTWSDGPHPFEGEHYRLRDLDARAKADPAAAPAAHHHGREREAAELRAGRPICRRVQHRLPNRLRRTSTAQAAPGGLRKCWSRANPVLNHDGRHGGRRRERRSRSTHARRPSALRRARRDDG